MMYVMLFRRFGQGSEKDLEDGQPEAAVLNGQTFL